MSAARRLSTISSSSCAPTVARLREVEPVREEEEEGAGSEEDLELSQDSQGSDQYSQGGLAEESMLEEGEVEGEVPPNLHQQLSAFIRSRPSLHQQVKYRIFNVIQR